MASAIQFKTPERQTARSPTGTPGKSPAQGFLPVLQEYTLLAEFKRAQKHAARGLYVCVGSHGHWDGVLFAHGGMYEGGVFRFRILIPAGYPTQETPRVFFQSTMFHPEINLDSGELSLKKHFPKWREGRDQLWHILKYIRYIFYTVAVKSGVNAEATTLLQTDEEAYRARVRQCVDDSAEDLKEKVPTNNEVCFHGETLPTTNYTELVGTMLGWGNDVAGGKGPSMAQAADRVIRIFGDDVSAVERSGGLRGMLKHQLGNAADTGDVRLGETACRGWLSMPDAEDDWQRRWVVLTFATQPPGPRLLGSAAELIASGSVALYEDERERDDQKIATDFTKDFHCRKICRAHQPNTQEMRMGNMFMVVLPDKVLRFQAQSTNAVRVWLTALCLNRIWPK